MRRRSLYGALFFVATAGSAMAVTSCSKDFPETTAPQAAGTNQLGSARLDELKDEHDWVGTYHTQALERAYARMSEKKNRGLSKADRCRVAMQALNEFHATFRRKGRPLGHVDVSDPGAACGANASDALVASGSVGFEGIPGVQGYLSAAATDHMSRIEQLFDTDASRSSIESSVYEIQSSASWTLPSDEAGAVVGTGAIALSSIAYWDDNGSSWSGGDIQRYDRSLGEGVASLSPDDATLRLGLSPRSKAIIKADVAAFANTVVSNWWLGVISAIEIAAYKAAIASIIAGIMF